MSVLAAASGLLAACAVALATRPGSPAPRPGTRLPAATGEAARTAPRPHDRPPGVRRHRLLLAVAAALLPAVLVGGPVGAALGAVSGWWAWRVIASVEPAGARRRREGIARDLPHAVDLLAVVLGSGALASAALDVVAAAMRPPLSDELDAVRRGLELGRDPVEVWRDVGRRPGLAGLSRTMVRALDSGSSVAPALHRYAGDLHHTQRYDAEERARRVGVKVAAPLGLCFLPAFVLVGVVPLVGATVATLLTP